ncbi:MAG: hypothetical protein LBE48_06250, partial [Methanomassiliicoccaceae archaeon]|nr:hypothetical protein [Methanomassiliicoccaceae archaeon]
MKKTIIIALAIAVILAIAIVPMANIMLDEKDPFIADDESGFLELSKGLSEFDGGTYGGGYESEVLVTGPITKTIPITAGTLVQSELPIGTYQIKEVTSEYTPTYFVNGSPLKAVNSLVTVTIEKDETTSVQIRNLLDNDELSDAAFEVQKYVNGSTDFASTESFFFAVYDEDGKLIDSAQTDADGIAKFTIKAEDLENDKIFKVCEESSNALYKFGAENPEGFIFVVAVFDGTEYTIESVESIGLVFYNEVIEEDEVFEGSFSIPVVVYDANGVIIDDATVFSFFFENAADSSVKYTASTENGFVTFKFSTAASGSESDVNYGFVPGIYNLYEDANAAYIDKTGNLRIVAKISNDAINFLFVALPKYVNELIAEGGFDVTKVVKDPNGDVVDAADIFTFVLKDAAGNVVAEADTVDGIASFVFSTKGGFKEGTYTLTEEAKAGYTAQDKTITVDATVVGDEIVFTFSADLVFVNEQVFEGGFDLVKRLVDAQDNAMTITAVYKFVMEDADGNVVAEASTLDGIASFAFSTADGFKEGTYYIYEVLTNAQKLVCFDRTDGLEISAGFYGGEIFFSTNDGFVYVNEVYAYGELCITKMIEECTEEYTMGDEVFTFVMYDEFGTEVARADTVDGLAIFSFSTKDGFKAGTYYIYEELTDAQKLIYVTPTSFITVIATIYGNTITFEFADDSNGTFYNDLLRGTLIISKFVSPEDIILMGLSDDATFTVRIYGPNFGTFGDLFEVPMNGTLTLEVILGIYMIQEEETGWKVTYILDGVTQSGSFAMVNIKTDTTYEVEIINESKCGIGRLVLQKIVTDASGKTRTIQDGVKFEMRDGLKSAGGEVIATGYTLNGFVDFGLFDVEDGFQMGHYFIYEAMTPAQRDMYKLVHGEFIEIVAAMDGCSIVFKLVDGSDIVFYNELISRGGFEIPKVVYNADGKKIDDATVFDFILESATDSSVQYTASTVNGVVSFFFSTEDGFVPGVYYLYEVNNAAYINK